MRYKIISMFFLIVMPMLSEAQNIIIQQNNNIQKEDQKVIVKEKIVYVEKGQNGPILVAGYLWVYPQKLGYYDKCPIAVINGINKKQAYGKNTWRLPTKEEKDLITSCKQINLEDYGYKLCTPYDHPYYIYKMWTLESMHDDYTINWDKVFENPDIPIERAYLILVCDD